MKCNTKKVIPVSQPQIDKDWRDAMSVYDRYLVGLNDTFFYCPEHSHACYGCSSTILNPQDVFEISKSLSLSIVDFIKKYCDCYIGPESNVPLITLKQTGKNEKCIFRKDGQCIVKDKKPTVCRLHPLGRVIHPADSNGTVKVEYINPNKMRVCMCGLGKRYTVQDWLRKNNLDDNTFPIKWAEIIQYLNEKVSYYKTIFTQESTLNAVYMAIYNCIYMSYNSDEEFMSQFLNNIERLNESFKTIEDMMSDCEA